MLLCEEKWVSSVGQGWTRTSGLPELGGARTKQAQYTSAGEGLQRSDPGDTLHTQSPLELRSQGQDVGNDVHALLTTIQGYWVFISEEENSGR